MAGVLAFLIPGAVAGGFTHMITPTVMAEKRQMATVSGFAMIVVVLSNYVLVGAIEPPDGWSAAKLADALSHPRGRREP